MFLHSNKTHSIPYTFTISQFCFSLEAISYFLCKKPRLVCCAEFIQKNGTNQVRKKESCFEYERFLLSQDGYYENLKIELNPTKAGVYLLDYSVDWTK